LLAWGGSIVAYGLLLGSIAKSGGKMITASSSLRNDFARLGISGAEAYLSVAYLLMAVVLSFVAVGQVNAARKEESGAYWRTCSCVRFRESVGSRKESRSRRRCWH